VHAYGGLVFHDAITTKRAKKALDANADGIIAVCGGAGGHAGTYNPFAFITRPSFLQAPSATARALPGTSLPVPTWYRSARVSSQRRKACR
jgi:NAD(P)H-dependent flavin oxidoreductase YrpB (nitropropane dioxygenase family)